MLFVHFGAASDQTTKLPVSRSPDDATSLVHRKKCMKGRSQSEMLRVFPGYLTLHHILEKSEVICLSGFFNYILKQQPRHDECLSMLLCEVEAVIAGRRTRVSNNDNMRQKLQVRVLACRSAAHVPVSFVSLFTFNKTATLSKVKNLSGNYLRFTAEALQA